MFRHEPAAGLFESLKRVLVIGDQSVPRRVLTSPATTGGSTCPAASSPSTFARRSITVSTPIHGAEVSGASRRPPAALQVVQTGEFQRAKLVGRLTRAGVPAIAETRRDRVVGRARVAQFERLALALRRFKGSGRALGGRHHRFFPDISRHATHPRTAAIPAGISTRPPGVARRFEHGGRLSSLTSALAMPGSGPPGPRRSYGLMACPLP